MFSVNLTPADGSTRLHLNKIIKSWQIGQILNATVADRKLSGKAHLRIGNEQLSARSSIPLSTGQAIKLLVLETEPRLIMETIKQPPATPRAVTVVKLIRRSLPLQAPIQNTLNKLGQQLTETAMSGKIAAEISSASRHQLRITTESIPTMNQLSDGRTLKQAILDSGHFFENKLVSKVINQNPENGTGMPMKQDLKANLLQLLSLITRDEGPVLRQRLPVSTSASDKTALVAQDTSENVAAKLTQNKTGLSELRTLVESAIARIQLNQSQSVGPQELNTAAWRFEIPVQDKTLLSAVDIRIAQDEHLKRNTSAQSQWSIVLRINHVRLGIVQANINILNTEVSVTFYAEKTNTGKLITNHQSRLFKAINKAGLNLRNIQHHEFIPDDMKYELPVKSLLSTKT